jgi:CcmD family protein
MYLLQQGPAQTTGYMIAGYAVIFVTMFIYLVSLVIRRRNLQQDLQVLQDLDQNEG